MLDDCWGDSKGGRDSAWLRFPPLPLAFETLCWSSTVLLRAALSAPELVEGPDRGSAAYQTRRVWYCFSNLLVPYAPLRRLRMELWVLSLLVLSSCPLKIEAEFEHVDIPS